MKLPYFAKQAIPPIVLHSYRRFFVRKISGWFGNYASWAQAYKECDGYDSEVILKAKKHALLKIKRGEAVYERDSVLFSEKQYSWGLLANLLWISGKSDVPVNVVDFGGSLGSTYFQNKEFLEHLPTLTWNIVEQAHIVTEGQAHFEDDTLSFYPTIAQGIKPNRTNICILSSVLQYLEDPFAFIAQLMKYPFEYLIIDRTAFVNEGKTLLTKQIVSPNIYSASYPAYFFNESEFLIQFQAHYRVKNTFESYCEKERYHLANGKWGYWKGFTLVKRY